MRQPPNRDDGIIIEVCINATGAARWLLFCVRSRDFVELWNAYTAKGGGLFKAGARMFSILYLYFTALLLPNGVRARYKWDSKLSQLIIAL